MNVSNWLLEKWGALKEWWAGFEPCHKESLGYTCRHRTYEDGTKECGNEVNYWKGDHE